MKVGMVVRRFSQIGGTERYTVGLARGLVGRGHEVHVWCQASAVEDLAGVQVHRLPVSGVGGLWRAWSWARAARDVDLGAHDVVLGLDRSATHHLFRAGGGAHRAWLERQQGVARWLWRLSPRQRLELALDAGAVGAAELVVANSELGARDVRRVHGHRAVVVVRNGVALDRFRPDRAAAQAARRWWGAAGRVVVFFGSGWRRKGLATALEAFAEVAGPRDRLVVMGQERAAGRFVRLAWRHGIGEQVVWHGPVSRPERWLPGADALVLPTRYDPAANVVLEALACGVPAVTSGADGAQEVLPEQWVVDNPVDNRGFADALREVLTSGQQGGALARAIAESWPVSRNVESMEQLLQEFVDARER